MNQEQIYRAQLRATQEMKDQDGLARVVAVVFVILSLAAILTALILPRYLQERTRSETIEQLEREAFPYR